MPRSSLFDSTRRKFMTTGTGAVLGGSALLGSTGGASGGGSGGETTATEAAGDEYAEAVDAGLDYFQKRADDQLPLVESLLDALSSGDETRAKDAYVESRYPYEEIEVLAGSFEETDADIDARPTSYTYGETSEKFVGFHRIERLLYRDDDVEGAIPYAEGLVESVEALQSDLRRRENFDPVSHFEGMIGLANEVSTKKITSEEETFSGQSLLIFTQNWEGICSQFEPFVPVVEARDEAVAAEVERATEQAQSVVSPYFPDDQPGATPYRMVGNEVRGEIVQASYRIRDALIDAAATLEIETSWHESSE